MPVVVTELEGVQAMVFRGNDVVLISDQQRMRSQEQDGESFDTQSADVRPNVAQQYALMEQAHDRIRRELAGQRRKPVVN
jgi:hypothetical protein